MNSRRTRSWLLPLLLIGGAMGLARHELRRVASGGMVAARGTFWRALDEQGADLRVRRGPSFRLEEGQLLELGAGAEGRTIRRVEVAAELHDAAAFLDIVAMTAASSYVLRVASDASFGVMLGHRDERGKFAALAPRAAGVALFQRVDLRLEHGGAALVASIGGKEVARIQPGEGAIESASVLGRGGRSLLHGLAVEGFEADGSTPFVERDVMARLATGSPSAEVGAVLCRVLCTLGLLALFLRSLCRGPAGLVLILRALAVWLVPLLLWLIAVACVPLPLSLPLVLVLLFAGFMPALFVLRAPLRADVAARRPLLAGTTIIACLSVGAVLVARHEVARFAPAIAAEQTAVLAPEPAPYRLDAPRHLAFDNALMIPAAFRNFTLTARVRLGAGAILQARLRAPVVDQAEGVALFLSADPRFASGFVEETHGDFRDVQRDAAPLPADQTLALRVIVEERSFAAEVDGRGLAVASSRLFPRGGIVLTAVHGEVDIEALAVTPSAGGDSEPSGLGDRLRAAAALIGFALLLSAAVALLLRRSWLAMLWPISIALLPAAIGVAATGPSGDFAALPLATWLAAAGLALLLVPLAVSRTVGAFSYAILTVLVGAAAIVAFRHCALRAWPQRELELSKVTPLDWHGDRLERELIHFQHPLHRRFNPYLVAHELRGRAVTEAKRPGVVRIAAIGTSSTYGYGARVPYPHRLEEMLQKDGLSVEVLVAAWPGASGSRQLDFLNNVILALEPDILTVSLFYNDSYVLSQIDERSYLARVTAPGYERGWFADMRDRLRAAMAERTYRELLSGGGDVEAGLAALVDRPPPIIFEEILREFASIARERDLGLLFIKEPTAGVRPWRQAFYEVMDRVGKDTGFPVAHPSPMMDARGGRRLYIDIVHPTDEGHQVMAEMLLPAVRRLVRQRTEGR